MPPPPTNLVVTLFSLFQNLSLLLSLALIYTVARPWLRRGSPQRSAAVTGVIFGVFAIAATFAPVLLASGARFDGRNILIAMSGAFGGPFSAIVSTLVFMIFRLWAGSNGLLPPITPLVPISTGIILGVSIWFYTRVGRRALQYTPRQLALLGLYIALQSLTVNIVSAPNTAASTLNAIGIPLLIGYPLATLLIGTLLVNEVRRTKLAEDLRESEQRFRQMAESIDQSFSLRDSKTGQILYVSPGFEKIWGIPAQVALESTDAYLQTIHPDDRARFAAERLEAAHESGHVYEYRVVRPDGSIRYVRALSYPVVEPDASVRRVAGIAEDVTERKRTEEALRASQHFIERITEAVPDILYVYDIKERTNPYTNRSLISLLGYSSEQIESLGDWRSQLLHPDDVTAMADYLERQKQIGDGEIIEFEYRMKNTAGEWRWLRNRDTIFQRDTHGDAQQIIGVIRDVTERLRSSEALRESEQRFRQMAESINQVFWLRDARTSKVIYLSPAYDKIWGIPGQSIIASGDPITGIHPDDAVRVAERISMLSDAPHEYEYRIVRPNGEERWIVSRSYPVVEADGSIQRIAGISEDLTERRHMDEALRESQHFVERIASTVPDRIFVYDITLGINVYANRDVTLGLGYTPEQAQTLGLRAARDLCHPDDLARLPAFEEQQKQMRDGEALEFEYRLKQANGDWRWFINRVSPFQRAVDGTLEQVIGVARDITDRKRSEEELRTSQHFVEQIAGTVPDGIFVFDVREQRFVYANVGISATIGYTPEEFEAMGSNIFPLTFHPDDLKRLAEWALRQRAMRDGDVEEFDYRLRHRNGETRYIVSRYSVFQRDAEGQVTQIIGVARDVTERHKIEEELEQSQHFVERIAGAVPDLLYVYDTRVYDKIFENRAVGDYLGYTPEQIALMGPRITGHLLHPDDLAYLSSPEYLERQKHLPDGEIIETEYRMRHANGDWRWLYSRDVPFLRADDGTVLQLIGIARDVTESKATEAALRQSQNFIERITNTVRDRIYVYDFKEKRSVYSNRDIGEMLGYTPEQIAALEPLIRTLMHPEDQASQVHYAEQLRQLDDGETLEFEYRMRDANGDWRWLYGHDTPFERDADGHVAQVLGLVRDITDRKRSEEKLRRYAEALERNNEELQMFAYTASHDLQEPLRKIQAFGDRLQIINEHELTDQGKDYLHRMMNAASRMQSLIQDLLAYSRITRINEPFSPVDMNAVAAAVCSDLEVLIAQTEAEVDLGPLYSVEADSTQMRQLLQNLIGNAIKFRAPDRTPVVHVSARLIDARDDGTEGDTPLYELTVSDNGIGFEEKYAERIFGMFQRLHGRNEYEGTGIGLAICRKIVERHHGTIRAIGNAGQGATFVVTIPVRQPIQEEVAT